MLPVGVIDDVIFVADSYYDKIFLSPLSPSDTSIIPLPFRNITLPVGLDFDPFGNHLYWTDYAHGTVVRASVDGQNQEIIRSGVPQATGIALDLVGGNVYWINNGNKTIEVSKLDGSYWKVLVSNFSSSPYDIALDTKRG